MKFFDLCGNFFRHMQRGPSELGSACGLLKKHRRRITGGLRVKISDLKILLIA
jgi:hypothetical protein